MHIIYDTGVTLSGIGGAVTHILEKASAVASLGYPVEIWTSGTPKRAYHGITFKQFGTSNKHPLLRQLQYFRYEITAAISILCSKNRSDTVILARQRMFGLALLICAKMKHIPIVYEVNDCIPDQMRLAGKLSLVKSFFINRLLYHAARKATFVLALTEDLRQMCINTYHISPSTVGVIPVGCRTDLFKPMESSACKKSLQLDYQNRYLLNVSTFTPWAGIEFILNTIAPVLKKDLQLHLLLVGSGITKTSCENLTHELKIEHQVHFIGSVPYEKVPLYIGASDICFCVKSEKLLTTSPTRLFEYLSCGKPVFVTPGYKRSVSCEALIAISESATERSTASIITLLNDQDQLREYSLVAHQFAVENATWGKIADELIGVFNEVYL